MDRLSLTNFEIRTSVRVEVNRSQDIEHGEEEEVPDAELRHSSSMK